MGSSAEDQQRDTCVYLYLLNCLTDLKIQEKGGKTKLDEASIVKQWGMTQNRVFVQRVLRSTLSGYYDKGEETKVPGLTLNRLVKILAALEDYWQKKRSETSGSGISRIITREEKLKAISKFSRLSFEEREEIDLSIGFIESLHQQLFETITHPVTGIKTKNIVPLYNNIFDIISLLKEKSNIDDYESLEDYIRCRDEFIDKFVDDLITKNIYEKSDKSEQNKKNHIERISKKVKREINRIEFQSGFAELKKDSTYQKYHLSQNDSHLLPFSFIKDLTKAVTENQIITDIFPVYIQHFEIEKTKPLPLYIDNGKNNGLLNPVVLQQDLNVEESQGLEAQFAYKVKVYFRIDLTESYKPKFEKEFSSISTDGKKSLEFFEESTGIGSVISLIIAAINKLLLWDIPILNEYLPIAQEVLSQDKPIYESVQWPVFSSALIKLCRKEDLEKALQNNKSYNQVANDQEIVRGEYCGFDLIETAAKAALYARLRAIKQTGIAPSEYRNQLCHKIEEQNVSKQAEKYLYSYPFSLKAMEGYLNQTILPKYRTNNKNFEFKDICSANNQLKHWSLVAYDAHLTLAKAYLQEGLYHIGKNFLDVIKPHMDDEEFKKGISSDLIRAKYELCQFRYYYLIDTQDLPNNISDRTAAIKNALERLNNAEECLKQNSSKYHIISQSSQSNFYPFFHFLSRVYSHRAKLCMFFPSYYFDLSNKQNNNNSVIDAIGLFERARIYAARDGNTKEYSYWTAYQSWCYFIAAYLKDDYQLPSKFSLGYCLSWAKRLIDDALTCYSATGKLCYQQIKDNGGNITSCKQDDKYYESYGKNQISVIPLIQELSENSNNFDQKYDIKKNILSFDISILKSIEDSKYLFGTSSSIILFSMGMLELCEEQESNKELKTRIKKAIKMFTYSSLIAGDGSVHNADLCKGEELYIDRIFNQDQNGYSLLKGLYPHRISQFADFGRIFVATCKAILILSGDDSNNWEEVHTLLEDLHQISGADSQYALKQNRYNGHLANHFEKATNYFKSLERNEADNLNQKSMLEVRNIIVKNIFRIMQGKDFK